MKTKIHTYVLATAMTVWFAACKSDTVIRHVPGPDDGQANSDDVGLRLRDFSNTRVSVVRARRPQAPAAPGSVSKHAAFVTDASSAWVYDISAPAFDDLNSLLCVFEQLRYLEMVSRGVPAYRAVVNLDACDSSRCENDDAQHEGAHPTQDGWLVQASGNIDDLGTTPVQVSAWGKKWVTNSLGVQVLADVYAQITVNMLGEELNPFGLGAVKAVYHYEDDTVPAVAITEFAVEKTAQAGEVKLTYVLDAGAAYDVQAVMYQNGAPEENTGHGKVVFLTPFMHGTDAEEIQYAYDDTYFKRLSNKPEHNCAGGTEACYYDHKTFYETALRYGFYDMAGNRVTRVPGMDVVLNYQEDDTSLEVVWANAQGLWYEDGSPVVLNSNTSLHTYLYNGEVGEELEHAAFATEGLLYKTVHKEGYTLDIYAGQDIQFTRYRDTYWLRWNSDTGIFETLGVWNEGLQIWEPSQEKVFFTGSSTDDGAFEGRFALMGTHTWIHPKMACASAGSTFLCTPSGVDAVAVTTPLFPQDPDLNGCEPYVDGPACLADAGSEDVSFDVDTRPTAQGQRVFLPYPNGDIRVWQEPLPVYAMLNTGVTSIPAFLSYESFGHLKGIPQGCVNALTHASVLCGMGFSRPLALYSLEDGLEISAGGETYLVRVMEREQRMEFLTEAPSTNLDLDEDLVLPEAGTALEVSDKPSVAEERSVAAGIITGVNCLGETCVGEGVDACRAGGHACAWHATCDEATVSCSCDEGYTGDGEDDCSPVAAAETTTL